MGPFPQTEEDISFLAKPHGIGAILSVQSGTDYRKKDVKWKILTRYSIAQGMKNGQILMNDFREDYLLPQIREAAERISEFVDSKRKVYVYCTDGDDLAPAAVIAYLCLFKKQTPDEAF